MKILIIEDEIQLVKSVALALREEGYVCEFAFTAAEADESMHYFPGARFCSEASLSP